MCVAAIMACCKCEVHGRGRSRGRRKEVGRVRGVIAVSTVRAIDWKRRACKWLDAGWVFVKLRLLVAENE